MCPVGNTMVERIETDKRSQQQIILKTPPMPSVKAEDIGGGIDFIVRCIE